MEQAGPDGAGTITAAALLIGGEPTFELVVYPALLRALPWFRGGRDVSVVLGIGAEAGTMRIMHPGPHRLHALVKNRLEKFPPVALRIRRLDHLRPGARAAEPVAHEVLPGLIKVRLPEWARPPVPLTAPATSFGPAFAGGVR